MSKVLLNLLSIEIFYHIACACQYWYDERKVRTMEIQKLEYVHEHLPEGMTPYTLYSIIVDQKEVGRLTWREGSDDQHYYDGHIGYHIEDMYRGHHYAYQACLLLREQLHFDHAILTCDPQNIASLKTIKKLGARYLETKPIPRQQRRFFTKNEKEKMIFIWE